ncbi:phospholipase [Planctomycetales bacterium]|nr:phospholipase [Planctomycetales bacterium]
MKIVIYLCLGLLLSVICFIGCIDSIARKIVFHPRRYTKNLSTDTYREVSFQNRRNETLFGCYFPYNTVAPDKMAAGTILYCHGNGENCSALLNFGNELRSEFRCNVLIFDYAGYGKSEGKPTARGILDDGRAARDWLVKEEKITNEQIIVYGFSLGGSVAVDIAAKDGARALIVESSFTSLGDMGQHLLPFLPANYLLRERLASVEKIGKYHGYVFISHGQSDKTIPFQQGKQLFDAANEPKTFYIPPQDYDHHSAPHCSEHQEKLRQFIDSLPLVSGIPIR